jgi:hypothetical protein
MRRKAIFLSTLALALASPAQGLALSNYGRSCENNRDCRSCMRDVKCLTCMQSCYNRYGVADSVPGEKLTRDRLCRKIQAKWCNAQCWDPDDDKEEGYVSTKPACRTAY